MSSPSRRARRHAGFGHAAWRWRPQHRGRHLVSVGCCSKRLANMWGGYVFQIFVIPCKVSVQHIPAGTEPEIVAILLFAVHALSMRSI